MARLTATYLQVGSTYPDFAQYGYNTANQRTFLTNSSTAYAQFRYDNIGQLTVADTSDNSADRGYSYDSAWNLNVLTNNGASESFLVDTRNQLTNAFSTTYGYDGNGNLISGTNGHTQYIYDDENRLSQWLWYQTSASQCTNGALSTDFFYDGLGRLRKRVEYQVIPQPPPPGIFGQGPPPCPWTQVSETHYIYDGFRVIQERDGLNNPQVSYTRGTDLSGSLEGAGGIGGLLARSSGYSGGNWTSHAYYHTDGNGNITAILDGSANLVGLYRYDPFGNIAAKTGTLADANVYRFSSKEMHLASGMYYFGFRFYDPNLQRWINRDPAGENRGANLYPFVENAPSMFIDPLGLYYAQMYARFGAVGGAAGVATASLAADAVTLGLNAPATPIEVLGGAAVGGAIGYGVGSLLDLVTGHTGRPPSLSPSSPTTPNYPVPSIPAQPCDPPAAGWQWRGGGAPGSGKGSWYNPNTGESMHPDLGHPPPQGPHWDWRDPGGNDWRLYPDGRVEPKK